MKVVIVDTGGANINSIIQALKRLGTTAELSSDVATINSATHVILPGVGAAGDAMKKLRANDLVECLRSLKQPTLGICLGMQLYFDSSDENDVSCLGLIPGRVNRFERKENLSIPHMGWNRVNFKKDSLLFKGVPDQSYFYFVHSYKAPRGEFVSAECDYGEMFPAATEKANFYGVQFHPEKSAALGAIVLRNFLNL
jgi:glutamine amidotransferase